MAGGELDAREHADPVEVRLLGPLRVRRADGVPVSDGEWRTGKNAELLRWLALEAGNPVPVDVLVDGLWPGVDEARARASLRTAASQLRRVLGSDVVERGSTGVFLTGAWVDAATFVEVAEDVARYRREGRSAQALTAAREADALYLSDVPTRDHAPAAVAEHAAALAAVHRRLLADAAEAAVDLGWMRDALDFADRLREVDPLSERASRSLMLAYAGIGEMGEALQEYERCRRVLADELGVDPSPQTRAVHLQLLQGAAPGDPAPPFVGRRSEARWLGALLGDPARRPQAGSPTVVLSGPEGSGRRSLAEAVCRHQGLTLVPVPSAQALLEATPSERDVLLWSPDADDLDLVARLLTEPGLVRGAAAVLLLAPCPGEDARWDVLPRDPAARALELGPLLADDVERLATHLLAGRVTAGLVEELVETTGGVPGAVTATVRRWASSGRLVVTSAGLVVTPAIVEQPASARRALARALPRLEGDTLEALLLAAVLGQPATPAQIARLLPPNGSTVDDRRARARAALDRLVDLALLRTSSAGAVWRHPLVGDAVYAWIRPAARQRLHRHVAGHALVSSSERVGHWLRAGERELACVAALDAARECSDRGDHAGARAHLLEVCALGDLPEADTGDRVDLFERLGDSCALLRRPDEAAGAYQQALEVAQAHLLPDAARLRRKVEASTDLRALELAPRGRAAERSPTMAGLGLLSARGPDAELESALRDAVAQADKSQDQRGQIHTRLQMAGSVWLPRRRFRMAHEWIEEAMALGPRPGERLRATLVRHLPQVLVGGAMQVRRLLEEASAAAEEAGEEIVWARLLGMRVVVAHDLGDPQFATLLTTLSERVLTGPVDEAVPELATAGLRVLVEREELDLAAAMAQHLSLGGGRQSLVMDHAARIATADLAEASGDPRQAAALHRSVVEEGGSSGCLLLVPEAAAKLVSLESAHDPDAAREAFEVYDDVVGASLGGPREEFWKRLARAALRAAEGQHEGAARASAQAGDLATEHGLQILAARARRVRAEHLRAARGRGLVLVGTPRAVTGSRAREATSGGPRSDTA